MPLPSVPPLPLTTETSFTKLLESLSRVSATNSEDVFHELLRGLAELVEADDAFAVLARKTAQTTESACPLNGWRPRELFFLDDPSPEEREQIRVWMSQPEHVASDRFTLSLVQNSGQARAWLRQDVIPDSGWHAEPTFALLQMRGMCDRIVGGTPLSPELELFVGLDRCVGSPEFGVQERDSLLFAMKLLIPVGRNLALSYGLAGSEAALTERERDVLRELLRGATVQEIADAARLSPHTVNDHLKAIYRKFKVRSRTELTALWLQSWES